MLYDGPQGTCCKQKSNAANKKETLQTKKKRCKQKRNAANKKRELQIKETLQTKNECCKQKTNAVNKKEHIMRAHAAEGTGQDGEMLAFPVDFAVRHDVLFGLWFTITHCSEVLS